MTSSKLLMKSVHRLSLSRNSYKSTKIGWISYKGKRNDLKDGYSS